MKEPASRKGSEAAHFLKKELSNLKQFLEGSNYQNEDNLQQK
jgi:hypothetical protein